MKDVDWPSWPTATIPLAHPGLLVARRYQLRSQLGVGAMGAVWLALDRRLGRPVALKQLVLEPGLDNRQATEARLRILREGRVAARLRHPNAVSIYDVVTHDGEPWLVTEYVPARSLADVLTEHGLLTDREAAWIGLQLADALQAAHQAGIVHRDVKPGNVLISPDGTVKLVDFGIARAAGDVTVTQTGVLTGTPDYFAPEVARGDTPAPEADVFALGATLYLCVEGQPPFCTCGNALTQLRVIADGAIRPPTRADRLTSVLTRMLAADPAHRPTAQRAGLLLQAVAHDLEPAPEPAPALPAHAGLASDPHPDRPGRTGLLQHNGEPDTTRVLPPGAAPPPWPPAGCAPPPAPPAPAAAPSTADRAALPERESTRSHRLIVAALLAAAVVALLGILVALLGLAALLGAAPDRPIGAPAGQHVAPTADTEAAPIAAALGHLARQTHEPADDWPVLGT